MSLEIATVPSILEILLEEGVINKDQQQEITLKIGGDKTPDIAGEIGVELGFYDEECLHKILKKQLRLKMDAIKNDAQKIRSKGSHEIPDYLKPDWGFHNIKADDSLVIYAIYSMVNMAQDILLFTNKNPDSADFLLKGIEASLAAAKYFYGHKSILFEKARSNCIQTIFDTLWLINSIEKPRDLNGNFIDMEDYINFRFYHIIPCFEFPFQEQSSAIGL